MHSLEHHVGVDGRSGQRRRGEERKESGSRGGTDDVPPSTVAREGGEGLAAAGHRSRMPPPPPAVHNVRDWLRVVAASKDRSVYELRYFNIAENEEE